MVLLTGATGLVGRYILAGLLRCGIQVGVLCRGDSRGSARQRVEQVLGAFESEVLLPRPRVLEGDLSRENLGLNSVDAAWLKTRTLVVLHCAASIKFKLDQRSGEPYTTNVAGTQRLLDMCRGLNVSAIHHVSTAYVAQRRPGSHPNSSSSVDAVSIADARAFEVVAGDPDAAGNDYERSKIEAERLVRECSWIEQVTIHRPSIVVGDSTTGFTSTFHGFYAPLQIGAQLAQSLGFSQEAGDLLRQQLGMSTGDAKNLVPVDWVGKAIARIVSRDVREPSVAPKQRILHWTNPHPTSCQTIQRAIVDAIEHQYGDRQSKVVSAAADARMAAEAASGPELFRSQMDVYESYFSDDPKFDASNSMAELPDFPCPAVDERLLRKLADFAIAANFGWPRSQLPCVEHAELADALVGFSGADTTLTSPLYLDLLGPGAPDRLCFGRVGSREAGAAGFEASASCVLRLSMAVFADCISGKTLLADAIASGSAAIYGENPNEWLAILGDWIDYVKARFSGAS